MRWWYFEKECEQVFRIRNSYLQDIHKTLLVCNRSVWDVIYLPHSSLHGPVFWNCGQTSVAKTPVL